MTIHEQLARLRLSFTPVLAPNYGNLDPTASSALWSAITQAVPLLAQLAIVNVDDCTAPLADPIKSTLRTGRKQGGRFLVPADPASRSHDYQDMDSSAVWTWQQLAKLIGGMTQQQVNETLEALAMAAFGDDILRIGFRGTFAAPNTDPATYPMGEDVTVGWPTLAKDADPDGLRVLRDPVVFDTSGAGNYADLDAMVYALIARLPATHRDDPRLRVWVGGDLLRAHKQAYLQPGLVRDKDQHLKIADLPVITSQHMASTHLAVTFPENLQVLTLTHSHRLNAGDIGNSNSWAIRYNRIQSYALGDPTAYTAFDAVTLATQE